MADYRFKELRILDGEFNIFNQEDDRYIIPLYQRSFAWTDKEIRQLIEDINDIEADTETCYYLGSLIVYKTLRGEFEVIDGQQRLTALYLILSSLDGVSVNQSLSFECREKSNYTLKNIKELETKDKENLDPQVYSGKRIVSELLTSQDFDSVAFKKKLQSVCLYRIEVPAHTDLNRYFEIMNTRGEQLEQQDIVKADLMAKIKGDQDRSAFAEIWDACSDMTGYVQMHFNVSSAHDSRDTLFGRNWDCYPTEESIGQLCVIQGKDNVSSFTIPQIVAGSFVLDAPDGVNENNDRVRFESIIDFKYFLLHALRVFVREHDIKHEDEDKKLIDDLLDDKKLRSAFERVLDHGVMGGTKINGDWFAMGFLKCMLIVRMLFDKFIIKREYTNEDSEGKWSLKELRVSGLKTQRKAYFANTPLNKKRERETTYAPRNKENLMLQSCLRVSYTSPKVMHWITELLCWLYQDNMTNLERLADFSKVAEEISRDAVRTSFLKNENYNQGVSTPHIVFNYLDYVLWRGNKDKYSDFDFEFRNSVEHWYPQHPTEGTFTEWAPDAGLNNFGNLCIIQRNVNSKFSNMAPAAKKLTFKEMISRGSLKLRLMAEKTIDDSIVWKEHSYTEHGNAMIKLLREACSISDEEGGIE